MGIETIGSPLHWAGFLVFIGAMLALDLGLVHRRPGVLSMRNAAVWSAVWVALALGFNAAVWLTWGAETGEAFLTGYLIEKGLSVDNLFVFYLTFAAFRVPLEHQHRLLFWGIAGALVLRAAMILAGSWVLTHLHGAIYGFGVVLLATGVKMLARPGREPHPERGRIFGAVTRVVPTTSAPRGASLFAREDGRLKATPFFLVLLLIELTDIVFAVDSILAVFAITRDPFVVFTSNIFAIMGMRSLYFLLAGMAGRFAYLQPGLALVLVFVGAKMVASHWVKVPVVASLAMVSLLLGGSIVASIIKTRLERRRARSSPGGVRASSRRSLPPEPFPGRAR